MTTDRNGAVVIAIDGPAASGKSSTAQAVARALGYAHLDSGALYRGLTLVALEAGQGSGRFDAAVALAEAARRGLELRPGEAGFDLHLDGRIAEDRIRSAEVTANVSEVSALAPLRDWVNSRLRQVTRGVGGVVVDGRDIGTVVFPEAALKVFLSASPRARAARRLRQRGEAADAARVEEEAARLEARDRLDASRPVAPLRAAPDAVLVDGTDLTFEDQVARIVALARGR
ncbi:MAG TPA: (d)CMP kinase [Gemmatimonadales bacterium]|nr:(d)CMP kinase [Gemmatimonadales bacterium]